MSHDKFNEILVEQEKKCRVSLMKWLTIEEKIMAQRAKITRLKIGNGNNLFCHASVKEKKGMWDCLELLMQIEKLLPIF